MNNPYGFDPNQTTEYDATWDYPNQQTDPPAAPPARYNPGGDLTTIKQTPTRSRPVHVPPPPAAPDRRDSRARASLWLGIISLAMSLVPVCGIVALFPAVCGLAIGWMGRGSPRWHRWAIAGMLLSALAIVAAFSIVL